MDTEISMTDDEIDYTNSEGQTFAVFPGKILKSLEFCGDMGLSSRGMELLDIIGNSKTEEEYIQAINKFDYRQFGYGEENRTPLLTVMPIIDLSNTAYNSCQYQYLSNFSGGDILVIDRARKTNVIPNGETAIYRHCEYLMTATEAKQQEEEKIAMIYCDK